MRMALGATRGLVQRAILSQTVRLAIGGLTVGFIASLGAARLIRSLLYATSPWDPLAYLVMAILLLAISLLSGYVPARRASRIEPMRALRGN